MNIKTVTVLGANGTMGANVSGIFAAFGNAKVYMLGRELAAVTSAKERAGQSVKADTIKNRLIPKTYDDLADCIKESDLIFESVSENKDIKINIYKQINPYIPDHTIIASGTSGISINELSQYLDEDKRLRYMGIHMFNPPYNMTLCEVIPNEHTDKNLLEDIKKYLSDNLLRDVVEVKDSAAFLANRIGFQFINEAMLYAERYQDEGGVDYIDSIMGPFTGRLMAPLNTANFVGLDVHRAIVDNLYKGTNDYARQTFILPGYIQELIASGKLGRKSGGGLYKSITDEAGKRVIYAYDIKSKDYRPITSYEIPFRDKMIKELAKGNYQQVIEILLADESQEGKICLELLLKYLLYSLATNEAVGSDIHAADHVMATGFSWIPPLALLDLLGSVEDIKKLVIEKIEEKYINGLDLDSIFTDWPKSEYDYRKFMRAK